jgi:1,4-dihydroxy-2-naphthoate octaprenyltransferase
MSIYPRNSLRLDHLDFPAVVGLAFVLAMGFLLVILSCALWANWLPLLVGELRVFCARTYIDER